MSEKRRSNVWLYVLSVIGLALFVFFSWNDPSLTQESHYIKRDVAVKRAADALERAGVPVTGWSAQAILDNDGPADGYLSQNNLHDQFDQKAPITAPIVYWKVTFNSPDGKMTDTVTVDPLQGRMVSYAVQNEGPSSSLVDEQKAQEIATVALQKVIGVDTTHLQVTDAGDADEVIKSGGITSKGTKSQVRPFRLFLFSDPTFQVGELTLSYEVKVSEGTAISVQPRYVEPGSFTQYQAHQKTLGMVLTGVFALLTFVMFVLAFVYMFLVKRRKPYWAALWLSLLVFGMSIVSNLNQMPVVLSGMFTGGTDQLLQVIGRTLVIVAIVVISFVIAAGTFPMIATGGALVHELKERLWTSWRSPEWPVRLRKAVWRGYLLAVIWLGFQEVFYWVAQTFFGVWSENDFSMSPTNTWWPALLPLMGWMAAVQEEMTYRLFGINFFKRYWKSTFLATLLPAMVWALGHSMYAVYPAYTRFIELTIFGVMIGYCYLWYGIETTIFAHAVFDITQMCIPLIVSGVVGQVTAGLLFLVSPILIGYGLSFIQPNRGKLLRGKEIV